MIYCCLRKLIRCNVFLLQEKEKALNLTVDVFCRLVKNHANVAQLITMYVDKSFF